MPWYSRFRCFRSRVCLARSFQVCQVPWCYRFGVSGALVLSFQVYQVPWYIVFKRFQVRAGEGSRGHIILLAPLPSPCGGGRSVCAMARGCDYSPSFRAQDSFGDCGKECESGVSLLGPVGWISKRLYFFDTTFSGTRHSQGHILRRHS